MQVPPHIEVWKIIPPVFVVLCCYENLKISDLISDFCFFAYGDMGKKKPWDQFFPIDNTICIKPVTDLKQL
jgi:hypothetical protein